MLSEYTTPPSATTIQPDLSGNIGSSETKASPAVPFNDELQCTLAEPVSVTLMRDLTLVAQKMRQVLYPATTDARLLKNWDLWGPLLLCLTLAITLSWRAPPLQSVSIFTGVFVIIWLGSTIVTLNAKLLGGKVSFFQTVCVLGYSLFPMVITAIATTFTRWIWVRIAASVISLIWCIYAAINFLSNDAMHLKKRRALTIYPLCLFYVAIAWLVLSI
ncbi:Yip1 domain-containing protein [Gongronella butleri]|nr:Yip1 domain-containing protein [Gongronella butleri]